MQIKRKISDFLCAFVVFTIVLVSIAALTGQSFFEGVVEWNKEEAVLSLFDTRVAFDTDALLYAKRLLCFNDVCFGKGASAAVVRAGEFLAQYIADGISLAFCFSKILAGTV